MPKENLDDQQKALEETLQKQQQLFETYSKTVLNTIQNIGKKYVKNIDDGIDKQKTLQDRVGRIYGNNWGKLISQVSLSFNNMLRDMTREAGRAGGFGELGVDIGRQIGANLGQSLTKKFSGISPALGRTLGSLLGGSVVAGLQSMQGIRMLGAKMMPVITAGRQQRTDFGRAGAQMLQNTIRIQEQTGSAREEIYGLATELSRLGIPFEQAGTKATQYALSAEMVLNLEKGTVKALDATVVAKYGESWEDVAQALQEVSSAQQYWNNVAMQTKSSLAGAISSNQTLVRMYSEVLTAMQGTALESKSISTALMGTVNVMGQMGLRPGMMGSISKEFIEKMAPKTQGDLASSVTQGFFISDLLRRSTRGMQILSAVHGVQERMHLDPNLITLPLNQLLASNDSMTGQYFGAMLEGVADMRDKMQGTEVQKQTSSIMRLQATLGTSPMGGYVMLTMADQYRANINNGMKPEEAWHAIGKSEAFQKATTGTEYAGLDPQEIFKIASGMGAASLSTEQKLSLAAESLAAMAGDKFFSQMTKEGKVLFDEAAMRLLKPGEAANATKPPMIPEVPEEEFMEVPPEGPVANPSYPPTMRPMFGYSISTSRGIEQVTVSSSDMVDSVAAGIAAVESKNQYGALGPVISDPSSKWFMDRAYGKYQIMGGNIPKWTKEATGREMNAKEFYQNPEAQEKTAKYQMEKLRRQGYGPEDIASIWHSGVPLQEAVKRNKVDVATKLKTPDYVRRVLARMPGRIG